MKNINICLGIGELITSVQDCIFKKKIANEKVLRVISMI